MAKGSTNVRVKLRLPLAQAKPQPVENQLRRRFLAISLGFGAFYRQKQVF